jgi:hypothetical protein
MTLRNELVGQILGIGQDILASALSSTGALLVQLGDLATGITDIDEAQWTQHTGFWSRPASPTQGAGGGACQAYTLKSGDRDIVIASRDMRAAKIPGSLNPGDTCIGCTNPQKPTTVTCGANGNTTIKSAGGAIELQANGNVTLSGSASSVALSQKIDSLITVLTTTYTPSGTETGFAALLAALQAWKATNWTNPTTGSSKVSAGQ